MKFSGNTAFRYIEIFFKAAIYISYSLQAIFWMYVISVTPVR